jgi:hypothetical protein
LWFTRPQDNPGYKNQATAIITRIALRDKRGT